MIISMKSNHIGVLLPLVFISAAVSYMYRYVFGDLQKCRLKHNKPFLKIINVIRMSSSVSEV